MQLSLAITFSRPEHLHGPRNNILVLDAATAWIDDAGFTLLRVDLNQTGKVSLWLIASHDDFDNPIDDENVATEHFCEQINNRFNWSMETVLSYDFEPDALVSEGEARSMAKLGVRPFNN